MTGIRKIRQAWIFCQTRRGRKNYKGRVAYRAKKEKMLTVKEANESINANQ